MSLESSAMDIVNWLESAVDTVTAGKRIRERYSITDSAWISRYRSDCGIESAYAFLKAWEYTGDEKYLTLSRELYDGIVAMQNADGSFPYFSGVVRYYTNDNSEVAIFLFRMAEIDKENATKYRAKGLEVTDNLLNIQYDDGSWQMSTQKPSATVAFTAHAVSALSIGYKFTGNKAAYKAAIESALAWISGKILTDGRVPYCETHRPPSSDQAITIRAFAHAELFVPDSENVLAWRKDRQKLMSWFEQLITDDGAVRNGLGKGVNIADTPNVTDHVYTTAFAIEAFYYSFCADGLLEYLEKAIRIVRFVQSNIYYSNVAEVNGVVRGAFNIADKNWDTSDAGLDANEQGGGNMVYTGWTNAPLAAHLFSFGYLLKNTALLSFFANNKAVRIADKDDGALKLFANGETLSFPIASEISLCASPVKIYANGTKQALSFTM